MKKLVLLIAAAMFTMLSMSADTYNYLNFVNSSNQITQFSTTGLRMTFNGGKLLGGRRRPSTSLRWPLWSSPIPKQGVQTT